jgi:hypothetical protein
MDAEWPKQMCTGGIQRKIACKEVRVALWYQGKPYFKTRVLCVPECVKFCIWYAIRTQRVCSCSFWCGTPETRCKPRQFLWLHTRSWGHCCMLLSMMPSTRSLIWLVSGDEECSAWRRGTSKNISEYSTIHCLWFGLCFVLTMFHHLLGQQVTLLEVPHQLLFLFNLVIELQIGIVYWYCVNLFKILLPSSSSIAWLKQKTVCIYSIWIF